MNRIKFLIILVATMVVLGCKNQSETFLKPPQNGKVYVVAHRGAHIGIPENTLAAYQKAIDLGADFVEIDLRTTRDSALVSVHNSKIDAYVTDGTTGLVSEFTLEELKAMDVGSRIDAKWTNERIPTFDEILELCKGKIGIYLDFKNADINQTLSVIKKWDMEKDIVWYADPQELKQVKKLCSECIIMPDPGPEKNLNTLLTELKPYVVASVWKYYSKTFLDACHKAGAIVIVDESDSSCWQQALDWGTDGIQTDDPEGLIKFLEK